MNGAVFFQQKTSVLSSKPTVPKHCRELIPLKSSYQWKSHTGPHLFLIYQLNHKKRDTIPFTLYCSTQRIKSFHSKLYVRHLWYHLSRRLEVIHLKLVGLRAERIQIVLMSCFFKSIGLLWFGAFLHCKIKLTVNCHECRHFISTI